LRKEKKLVKEAIVLLIAAFLVFSSLVVTADTTEKPEFDTSKLQRANGDTTESHTSEYEPGRSTLFYQRSWYSDESWSFYTSDLGLDYLCQENFWGIVAPISDIHWWGLSLFWTGSGWVDCDPTGMLFDIIFYEDDGGAPGAAVCTYSGVSPTFEVYDVFAGAYTGYHWSVDVLDPPCVLEEGWVSIQSVSSPNDCSFLWSGSPDGDGDALQDGGSLFEDLALELTGEIGGQINIEKQVLQGVSYPCLYTICLYDSFGDGWGTGYLNVSVNGVTVLSYLTCPTSGPDCFDFEVYGGDLIEVYYWDPDPWPSENSYELYDCEGVLVASGVGESPADPEPEIVYTTPLGILIDADDPESAVDWEICTLVPFVITITNTGDFPLIDFYVEDIMHDSLEFVEADPWPDDFYYDPPYWYIYWYFPGPLNPGEAITITIWAHVLGPHCSIDENYINVEAFCPETQEYVFDEDSAFIHCIDTCHIDVEKYVRVSGDDCNFQICLEDSFGDGWGTGYLDVYVNGEIVLSGITCPASGPDCFEFEVSDLDVIEVYYWDPDPWPSENYYYLKDCGGNVIAEAYGESPDDPEPEMVVTAEIGEWVDADTMGEAVDMDICTNIVYLIAIHNDGACPLEDIWVYDWYSDSIEFVEADPAPTYTEPGYLEWTSMGWDLMHCEWLYIYVTFHVVGPEGEADENLAGADGWCPCESIYVYDEDSAWINPVVGDTTPPVTTHELDGTMGENDWYISDVTITLEATDDDSGVDYTMISIDGGAFEEYTAPVVVSDDGEHEFEYYSVDNAGNEEPINGPFDFKIDQTPPTIDLTSEKTAFNKWLFTAECEDATSGMDKVEFYLSIDGGAYTLEDTVTSEPYEYEYTGLKNITVKAIAYDNAGLSSEDTAALSTTEYQTQNSPLARRATETRGI
jgi:hypothetical protein